MTPKTKKYRPFILLILMIFASVLTARSAAAGAATALFVRSDTTTQGNWQGVYGTDGYVIPDTNTTKLPGYLAFSPQNQATWTWTSTGTEVRDLQVPGANSPNARQASCWYPLSGTGYSLDVNITDGNTHQFSLYMLDWDKKGRVETIQALDATTGAILDTRSLSNFDNGTYYVWTISGHVKFTVSLVSGVNAVTTGAFFDTAGTTNSATTTIPTSAAAQFLASDTNTQGNWHGAYGSDGYTVVNGGQLTPPFSSLKPQNQLNWTWAANTTDPRALQSTTTGNARIAATWYGATTFSIDLNLTDGNSHQVAVYAVDWDSNGRAETIQVLDAQTKAVLDSRKISSFANGIYLVWNISGHVTVNVTTSSANNAVISGVFFGSGTSTNANNGSSTPPPAIVVPPTTSGSTSPVTSGSSTTPSPTLPNGLVLHWTFDTTNISGTTVADTSNQGGSGTIHGSLSPVAGKVNQALGFNGVNSYVSMSEYADPATGFNNSVTLAAWIETTNTTRTESIISKFSAAGSASGYIFGTDASGHLELRIGAADLYAYPALVVDTAQVNDGQWHHVAVVITMGHGAQFYVDGTATSSAAMSVWAGGDGYSDLEVGTCSYLPSAQYFTGNVDDVQIYNQALTAADINSIFSLNGQNQSTQTTTTPSQNNQATLAVNPSSFSFGSVNIGNSVSQNFVVSNTGTSTLTLSTVVLSGAGLTATGLSNGTMLSPGQTATLSVTYRPASTVALNGGVTFTSNASNSAVLLVLSGTGLQAPATTPSTSNPDCPSTINAVAFNGIDTTTQGAWKGLGNFNAPPAGSSFIYGKDGDILPDTESCDGCNPFPSYVSFGPKCVGASTQGNLGAKPYSTHASAALVQGSSAVMGAEPQNATNTNYFQCNYTYSNAATPWGLMVAWRPAVDTREISNWYTCAGITSYYLEFSFGNSTHNFEVYVADDQNGGTRLRSQQLQILDGETDAVLYDSGSFTNFTGGVYYKWSITGHVKVKVINTSTNGTNAVINGAFFN